MRAVCGKSSLSVAPTARAARSGTPSPRAEPRQLRRHAGQPLPRAHVLGEAARRSPSQGRALVVEQGPAAKGRRPLWNSQITRRARSAPARGPPSANRSRERHARPPGGGGGRPSARASRRSSARKHARSTRAHAVRGLIASTTRTAIEMVEDSSCATEPSQLAASSANPLQHAGPPLEGADRAEFRPRARAGRECLELLRRRRRASEASSMNASDVAGAARRSRIIAVGQLSRRRRGRASTSTRSGEHARSLDELRVVRAARALAAGVVVACRCSVQTSARRRVENAKPPMFGNRRRCASHTV
jgi:hypothetical protein